MDMITLEHEDVNLYIKDGAHINLGAYKFQFHNGMLFIEEVEVFGGLVLKPFPVQIFKMAMENPYISYSVRYPTKAGDKNE